MKAGYGKTVRPVCAADGGKLFIGRLLRPDSWEADEQSRSNGGGVGGAKGGGHGEREPAKHIPGAAPETCVTGAGARTTSRNAFCRQTPKVGAACGNSACADLCGGRPVTAVPTANLARTSNFGRYAGLRKRSGSLADVRRDPLGLVAGEQLGPSPRPPSSCTRIG